MIKTSITPQNSNYTFQIPNQYIGKELEVLIYAKDEINTEKISSFKSKNSIKGILTSTEADKFQIHISNSRKEWERDI